MLEKSHAARHQRVYDVLLNLKQRRNFSLWHFHPIIKLEELGNICDASIQVSLNQSQHSAHKIKLYLCAAMIAVMSLIQVQYADERMITNEY